MALVWAGVILLMIWAISRRYKYKCPALGCDFSSPSEEDAAKHAALHARHKPALKEVY